MRRERYQASIAATRRPSTPASASRSISGETRSSRRSSASRRRSRRSDVLAEDDRVRDGEVRPLRARRRELEGQRLARDPVDRLRWQLPEARRSLARERGRGADEVDLVAGRTLEVRRVRTSAAPRSSGRRRTSPLTAFDVELRDPVSLALQLVSVWSCEKSWKSRTRSASSPAREHDPREEHERQPDAKRREQRPASLDVRRVFCASFAGETL